MEVRSQQAFKDLVAELEECQKLKTNLLIVTLPGTGMGRFLDEYVSSNKSTTLTVIKYDWSLPGVLEKVEASFKSANADQKFAVSINFPHLLETSEIKNSYFLNHTYRRYYFGVRNQVDSQKLALEINPRLSQDEIDQIYKQSDGFAQIIKYLAVNGIQVDEGLAVIKKPITDAIQKCNLETLTKLGLTNTVSLNISKNFDIKINFDLTFQENGQVNPQSLTAFEKEVLEKMISSDGAMTKSQVSDIKWGEGKYDEFSDQAVNKAMRRLSDKLVKYTIETIPKVGFILKKK